MAKRTQVKLRRFKRDDDILGCHHCFVYEIEIYKTTKRTYNLEDTKTIQSQEYQKNSVKIVKRGDAFYRILTKMIAAPVSWLIENKFKEQEDV